MSITDIYVVVMVAAALIGGGYALLRMTYHRGGLESRMTKALEDNTVSNHELTAELRDFKEQTVEKLHGLDTRVTVLEHKG